MGVAHGRDMREWQRGNKVILVEVGTKPFRISIQILGVEGGVWVVNLSRTTKSLKCLLPWIYY